MIGKYLGCITKMIDFCEEQGFEHYNFRDFSNLITSSDPERIISLEEIKEIVAGVCGVFVENIDNKRRFKPGRLARQFVHYYGLLLTKLSQSDIGARTGGRTHATVINSRKRISQLSQTGFPEEDYQMFIELEILFTPYVEQKYKRT